MAGAKAHTARARLFKREKLCFDLVLKVREDAVVETAGCSWRVMLGVSLDERLSRQSGKEVPEPSQDCLRCHPPSLGQRAEDLSPVLGSQQ